MNNDLKTWRAPKLSTLDVDQTLSAGWIKATEGSWDTDFPILNKALNFISTPGGS